MLSIETSLAPSLLRSVLSHFSHFLPPHYIALLLTHLSPLTKLFWPNPRHNKNNSTTSTHPASTFEEAGEIVPIPPKKATLFSADYSFVSVATLTPWISTKT